MSSNNIIELRNVFLRLGSGASQVQVLDGVNLAIGKGETVALLGPSGSGKSTLLMVIAGLENTDRGEVVVEGRDLTRLDEDGLAAFRGQSIGIIFQSFHLIPNMTALENVAVPLELAGKPDALERASRELQAIGLGERRNHYPAQLSGGEQQRVAIARALAVDPKIIVADEPTGSLDTETGNHIADLLFEKLAERGATLVLVTHDPELAKRCQHMLHIRAGRIEENTASGRNARNAPDVAMAEAGE